MSKECFLYPREQVFPPIHFYFFPFQLFNCLNGIKEVSEVLSHCLNYYSS